MTDYTFNLHRHNYAIWTAARAVQRNFTSTASIKYAIEHSGLREFAESDENTTVKEFNAFHRVWAEQLKTAFKDKSVYDFTYGRAAKIISIYLKTSVILCNQGKCTRSSLIHPPIDGILLKRISMLAGLKNLATKRWTQFGEDEYWDLVERLKEYFKVFDWRLEYYWSPERE